MPPPIVWTLSFSSPFNHVCRCVTAIITPGLRYTPKKIAIFAPKKQGLWPVIELKMSNTAEEFATAKEQCRTVFTRKMEDYGTSWRVMRASSLTDQIFIKASRIRSLEEKGGHGRVAEGVVPEFIGIVNYSVMALIQLSCGSGEDWPADKTLNNYNGFLEQATRLMNDKNHDYDEAWRHMRVSSFTDIILQKLRRIKEIEDHAGRTQVSEGIDAGYMDIINYALFALIKLA